MASKQQRQLKLIIIGDAGIGKTSLLDKYVNNRFKNEYQATIGSDFLARKIHIDGKSIDLQIWDTAGQEQFQSLGNIFYRGANAVMLAYDVTKADSFRNIEHKWRKKFIEVTECDPSVFPFVVIGNKVDLADKVVQTSAGREYCQMNGDMLFYEVSAKTGENVQIAFESIAKLALERTEPDEYKIHTGVLDLIDEQNKPQSKECAC